MDNEEARQQLAGAVDRLRSRRASQLVAMLDGPEAWEEMGPSGVKYQLEAQVSWDTKPGGNLRVVVSIDDGGWRAFAPLSDDFIVAPEGHLSASDCSHQERPMGTMPW